MLAGLPPTVRSRAWAAAWTVALSSATVSPEFLSCDAGGHAAMPQEGEMGR